MKRPFAIIGFSMLATFLIISNLTFNQTVAVLLTATVLFCLSLFFKKTRKSKIFLTVLLSVAIFSMSFITAQNEYIEISSEDMHREIEGVVCQTPTNSDYANTYIIKVYGENYKIRYVSEYDMGWVQGDTVSGKIILQENKENTDYKPDKSGCQSPFLIRLCHLYAPCVRLNFMLLPFLPFQKHLKEKLLLKV